MARLFISKIMIATGLIAFGAMPALAAQKINNEKIKNKFKPVAKEKLEAHADAPIVIAAKKQDHAQLEALIISGVDLNHIIEGDGSALMVAAALGDEKSVSMLIKAGADVNLMSKVDGTALVKAAQHNHKNTAKKLVAAGADINGVTPNDETALINAARKGHLDMVIFLVDEAGADISLGVVSNSKTKPVWRSPLGEARRKGHADVINYLVSKGAVEGRL